jgi:hypothetical protein
METRAPSDNTKGQNGVVESHSPLLEVKVTPRQKAIHYFTPTRNPQNKKLLK